MAVATPIFKSNDKESHSNYRPISAVPCFSKILEKLMCKRVIKFFGHDILSESQFGFRKKRSSNLTIMELVERTSKAIDNTEYTKCVFLDLSKAFDTVNHSILLHKVEHYGKRGVALEWFNNYLSNRKQVVKYRT